MSGEQFVCQVCGSGGMERLLDLGNQPLCNDFLPVGDAPGPQTYYPLCVCFCHHCSLAQLDYVIPTDFSFGDQYTYLTGSSESLIKYYSELANKLIVKFGLEPASAVSDLVPRRHPVAPGRLLSRKAPAHRGHVDRGPKRRLVQTARLLKPAEERLPGRPREWPSKRGLLVPRRLSDQQHLADHRSPAHHWTLHQRTPRTAPERAHVPLEPRLRRTGGRGPGHGQ